MADFTVYDTNGLPVTVSSKERFETLIARSGWSDTAPASDAAEPETTPAPSKAKTPSQK